MGQSLELQGFVNHQCGFIGPHFVGSSSSHLSSTEAFGNATNDEDPGHSYYAIDYNFTTDLGVHSVLVQGVSPILRLHFR